MERSQDRKRDEAALIEKPFTTEQRKKIEKKIEEMRVPDEDFSSNRLFFQSFAKTAGIVVSVFAFILLVFFLIMWLQR